MINREPRIRMSIFSELDFWADEMCHIDLDFLERMNDWENQSTNLTKARKREGGKEPCFLAICCTLGNLEVILQINLHLLLTEMLWSQQY